MRTISLLILSTAASSVMSACDGPNFISEFYDFPVIGSGEKAEVDNTFGVCGFANAAEICCSKDTLDTFQSRITTYKENLEVLAGDRDEFLIEQRGVVLGIRDSLNKLNDIIKNADASAVSAYAAYLSGLKGLTETFTEDFADLVSNFEEYQKARVTCMEKLLTAQVSVWCTACSFDFTNEAGVDETGNGSVTFHDDLIAEISEACYDYFTSSATQSTIISLSTVADFLASFASGIEKVANGDTSAVEDLTKAVNGLLTVENSNVAAEKPVELPESCTKASCPWIETTLFNSGIQLVNNTAIMGGVESEFSFIGGSGRVLKGDGNRRLAGTNGFSPDLSAIDVTLDFAENPREVDNTQNASAFRNGIVACAVAAFALFF